MQSRRRAAPTSGRVNAGRVPDLPVPAAAGVAHTLRVCGHRGEAQGEQAGSAARNYANPVPIQVSQHKYGPGYGLRLANCRRLCLLPSAAPWSMHSPLQVVPGLPGWAVVCGAALGNAHGTRRVVHADLPASHSRSVSFVVQALPAGLSGPGGTATASTCRATGHSAFFCSAPCLSASGKGYGAGWVGGGGAGS